jgi:2'-5' RNA ligase
LQRDLDSRLRADGFRIEDRPFAPHFTLGRASPRGRRGTVDVRALVAGSGIRDYGSWVAEDVEVIQSNLQPSGAVYTTLFAAPLAG